MSKGKATPETVKNLVHTLWLTNQEKSGAQIHRTFELDHGTGIISKRKVQQLITNVFKRSSTGGTIETFPLVTWEPWADKRTSSAAQAFLLRLDAVNFANYGRRLYQVEAKWGERLRVSLEGLSVHDQLQIARLYAAREVSGYYFETEPLTDDLDAMCAYRPWCTDNKDAYACAIICGLVPMPVLVGVEWAGDWVNKFTRSGWSLFPEEVIRPPRVVYYIATDSELRRIDEVRAFWSKPPGSGGLENTGESGYSAQMNTEES